MKDLRHIYSDIDFKETAKKIFNEYEKNNDCDKTSSGNKDNKWRVFKDDFLRLTDNKCPICEDTINMYDDIDHFRPKSKYDFLKCKYENFIILCNICNRSCKGDDFPLNNDFKAKDISELHKEKPLLINPCYDNIFEFFELEFILSIDGKSKRLILIPNRKLEIDSYKYKRAITTIEFYGLGECSVGKAYKKCRDNKKVDSCRVKSMKDFYIHFIDLICKLNRYSIETDSNIKHNLLEDIKKISKKKRELNYGFYDFIKQNQFIVNIPSIHYSDECMEA